VSVVKGIFSKNNIGTVIFFLLNSALIIGLFILITDSLYIIPVVLVLNAISILIAFSRFGDWVLSVMTGARKMTRADMKVRMRPLLEIIYKKAMKKTPGLSNQLRLKVMYTPVPNAYAIGRRTICVTEGLFSLPDDIVQGVLAHEVAHLALKHTHIQLIIGGGNFIMTVFILILQFLYMLFGIISLGTAYSEFRQRGMTGCLTALPGLFVALVIWLWTKFCMLFLMWSSRESEYDADKYTAELGYGLELAKALDTIGTGEPQESFFKALYSTHPNTHDRIGRLQQLGVSYYRY
jgi:heat shock protein HtpX